MSTETDRELQDFGWCIVEIFGHRKLGAQCREVPVAGGVMLRCDIPGTDGAPGFTQFYGAASLFCVSPTSEDLARAIAARFAQPPVQRYELPSRSVVGDLHGAAIQDDGAPWEDDDADDMPFGSPDDIEEP